jgi:hypothetical protein
VRKAGISKPGTLAVLGAASQGLSEFGAGRPVRLAEVAFDGSEGGFIKAMFFIFRYLCCKTEGRPRRRESRADGVTRARAGPGSRTIGSGDIAGRLFCFAQPTGTESARTFEISDLRFPILGF